MRFKGERIDKEFLKCPKLSLGSSIGDTDRANVEIVKTFGQGLGTPFVQSILHDTVSERATILVATKYHHPMVVEKYLGTGDLASRGLTSWALGSRGLAS
ncbi:hypothetical protein NPIL_610611 [Nephila pilipes]|uniref:Uncharacterized protein n=1 Tax=Nephila pilipes TaxID=299642 RepID=A0A8X6QTP8_NEPPI|nr:hypothetical protein NPIL_610611 [Nephila pilipes]